MSYKIVITYTKTTDSPDNAFSAIPVLEPYDNVTQEQINTLQNTYPTQYETHRIQDQMIMSFTYNSEEDYNALNNTSIVTDLKAKRRAWAESNKLTFDVRVI
jgi:hypothetical protein